MLAVDERLEAAHRRELVQREDVLGLERTCALVAVVLQHDHLRDQIEHAATHMHRLQRHRIAALREETGATRLLHGRVRRLLQLGALLLVGLGVGVGALGHGQLGETRGCEARGTRLREREGSHLLLAAGVLHQVAQALLALCVHGELLVGELTGRAVARLCGQTHTAVEAGRRPHERGIGARHHLALAQRHLAHGQEARVPRTQRGEARALAGVRREVDAGAQLAGVRARAAQIQHRGGQQQAVAEHAHPVAAGRAVEEHAHVAQVVGERILFDVAHHLVHGHHLQIALLAIHLRADHQSGQLAVLLALLGQLRDVALQRRVLQVQCGARAGAAGDLIHRESVTHQPQRALRLGRTGRGAHAATLPGHRREKRLLQLRQTSGAQPALLCQVECTQRHLALLHLLQSEHTHRGFDGATRIHPRTERRRQLCGGRSIEQVYQTLNAGRKRTTGKATIQATGATAQTSFLTANACTRQGYTFHSLGKCLVVEMCVDSERLLKVGHMIDGTVTSRFAGGQIGGGTTMREDTKDGRVLVTFRRTKAHGRDVVVALTDVQLQAEERGRMLLEGSNLHDLVALLREGGCLLVQIAVCHHLIGEEGRLFGVTVMLHTGCERLSVRTLSNQLLDGTRLAELYGAALRHQRLDLILFATRLQNGQLCVVTTEQVGTHVQQAVGLAAVQQILERHHRHQVLLGGDHRHRLQSPRLWSGHQAGAVAVQHVAELTASRLEQMSILALVLVGENAQRKAELGPCQTAFCALHAERSGGQRGLQRRFQSAQRGRPGR
mmetsp:Transcript_7664/g.23587  ORF Transcript_7664/g.23587 Transcript_7664/m.23587 type:complete len:783 (+) Transcript_7664:3861-6209(+)